MVTNVTKKIF